MNKDKSNTRKKPKAYIHANDRDMTAIHQALSKEFPDGYPDVCVVYGPIYGPKLQHKLLEDGSLCYIVEEGTDEEIIAAVKEEMKNHTSPFCDLPVYVLELERRVVSQEEFLSVLGLG